MKIVKFYLEVHFELKMSTRTKGVSSSEMENFQKMCYRAEKLPAGTP